MSEDRLFTAGEMNTLNAAKAWLRSKKDFSNHASPIAEVRLTLAVQQLFDEEMRSWRERKQKVTAAKKRLLKPTQSKRGLRLIPGGKTCVICFKVKPLIGHVCNDCKRDTDGRCPEHGNLLEANGECLNCTGLFSGEDYPPFAD